MTTAVTFFCYHRRTGHEFSLSKVWTVHYDTFFTFARFFADSIVFSKLESAGSKLKFSVLTLFLELIFPSVLPVLSFQILQ